jgi:hypothetical protein
VLTGTGSGLAPGIASTAGGVRLGDGTAISPRVVAVYGSGLGFGDITLPNATVADHTRSRADTAILVRVLVLDHDAGPAGHAVPDSRGAEQQARMTRQARRPGGL